jgi:hypothetical protein
LCDVFFPNIYLTFFELVQIIDELN